MMQLCIATMLMVLGSFGVAIRIPLNCAGLKQPTLLILADHTAADIEGTPKL